MLQDNNKVTHATLFPVEEGAKVTMCGMHELFFLNALCNKEELSRHVRHCVPANDA